MAESNNGGGLLGSLLLPAYTDAGANDTFTPKEGDEINNTTTTAPTTTPSEVDAVGSDAATEIHDNRSLARAQFRKATQAKSATGPNNNKNDNNSNGSSTVTSSTIQTPRRQAPAFHKTPDSSNSETADVKYSGFFPSTKPLPTFSPTPESPPNLKRRQLPLRSNNMPASDATSTAGTSVVPETGAFDFSTPRLQAKNPLQRRTTAEDSTTSPAIPTLNAANLEKAERLANHTTAAATDNDSTTDSSTSKVNRESSLLQEEDEEDDDVASDAALSTASEMGTVIEIGNQAARMAEIDAMAALIEASPNVDQLTPRPDRMPPAPSQTPQHRSGTASNLALPVLDAQPDGSNHLPNELQQPQPEEKQSKHRQPELSNDKQRLKTSAKASEMLTTAIRRIGTGIHKTKASLSAPPTPKTPGAPAAPALEDLLKSTLTPRGMSSRHPEPPIDEEYELPASLALRSPGSSARVNLRRHARMRRGGDQPSTFLAPRFSHGNSDPSTLKSLSLDFPLSNTSQGAQPAQGLSKFPLKMETMSPFRVVQKAFSFDSILDDPAPSVAAESTTSSQLIQLEASLPARRTEYERTPMATHLGIHESVSWDVGGATATTTAFRAEPHRSYRIGGMQQTPSQEVLTAQRNRIHSDFSPSKRPQTQTMLLKTPQRVMDVEREDALDILACLVERGIAPWSSSNNVVEETREAADDTDEPASTVSSSSSMTTEGVIAALVDNLRKSKEEKDTDKSEVKKDSQIEALEELLKSHSYALEMKRASLSASGWLKSIGRTPAGTVSDDSAPTVSKGSEVGQASGEADSDTRAEATKDVATAVDQKMEFLTLRARLNKAEQDLKEKTEMTLKMDQELSKCRAEIGRLQIASRAASELNQSKSMLDDDAEDSTTASVRTAEDAGPGKVANGDTKADGEDKKLFDESFEGDNSLFQDAPSLEGKNTSQELETLDILVFKTALEEANQTIRDLYQKLESAEGNDDADDNDENKESSGDKDNDTSKGAPVVAVPDISMVGGRPKRQPSMGDEHRTVNVRMLDGENFVTEWDELTPLPPPPDHGIQSPIVDAVLQQWTNDRSLHESLLAWIDRVMKDDNLEDSVPPLTISSLDHQVRDGFTMHVLPLLLRRADIHVSVHMRAHRKTTYDLAVTVSQKTDSSKSPSLLDHHHMHDEWQERFQPATSTASVAHSAVTEAIANSAPRHQPHRNEEDGGYSHFGIPHPGSEDGPEDTPQPSLMGALGGALGGLLSRNKYTGTQSPSRFFDASSSSIPPTMRSVDLTSSPVPSGQRPAELDNQPYHRVVSAPPGRIGVTFVEYRGHAMVSDVAPDSPLSSWVFPSDILIAVDEVPVSGMRVRNIIQVLTNRKDRQRALRVISSHAMNEFTLNQSTYGDDPP